ncbi:MAG: RHS repeat-associated core domain-containing protein, partial [Blastocatellia bacterium]
SYDADGNITQLVDTSGTDAAKTVNYGYDGLNRLTSATATGVATGQQSYSQVFSYDGLGNILSRTDTIGSSSPVTYAYAYQGNQGSSYANPDAVTSVSNGTNTTTYAYDKNGNVLSDGNLSNLWDYNNQLVQSVVGSGQNAVTLTYSYDQTGERLTSNDGTTTTIYPTKYCNVAGTNAEKHVFANGQAIATITGTGSTASVDYVAADHLTGANVVTDSSGSQQELIDYYPFGAVRLDEKTGFNEQRKFAGHEYDSGTGLSYMDARYYNPAAGRFESEDQAFLAVGDSSWLKSITKQDLAASLGEPQKLNPYTYAGNNPIINIDPTGQSTLALPVLPELASIFGAVEVIGGIVGGSTLAAGGLLGIGLALSPVGAIHGTNDYDILTTEQKASISSEGSDQPKPQAAPKQEDIKGKTPEEVDKLMRDKGWHARPSRGGGTRYAKPGAPGEQVRVEPGSSNNSDPVKRGPYGKISTGGPQGGEESP